MLIKALQLKPFYAPDGDGDGPDPVEKVAPPPEEENEEDLELSDAEDQDAGDADGEFDEGEEQQAQPQLRQPRKSAPSERIRQLNEDRKREAERASALEREIAALRAERQAAQALRDAQTEEDRLALMTAEERFEYKLNKATEENKRVLAQQQFQNMDQMDRLEFRNKLPPRYARFADEVETTLQKIRSENKINVPRETVLKLVLGEKLLEQASKQAPKGRETPRRQPPPVQNRGDMNGDRRPRQSLEKRLENVAL